MWHNETFKCWLFLVGFTHLFYSTAHRRVPSVSFVCLLNFHKTPSLLHKPRCTLQTFAAVLLVTPCSPSLHTGNGTRAWRTSGTGVVLLSTAEPTKLCASCGWNDIFDTFKGFLLQWLNTVRESLGWDFKLVQTPAVVLMGIWTGKCQEVAVFSLLNKKILKWYVLDTCTVHLYKRAQFWLHVGFYPRWLSLQWECTGWKQICIISKCIADSVRGRVSSLPPAFLTSQGLVMFTLWNSGGSCWCPRVILMTRRNIKQKNEFLVEEMKTKAEIQGNCNRGNVTEHRSRDQSGTQPGFE